MDDDFNKPTNQPAEKPIDKLFESLRDKENTVSIEQTSTKKGDKKSKKKGNKKAAKLQAKDSAMMTEKLQNQYSDTKVEQSISKSISIPQVKMEKKAEKKEEKPVQLLTLGSNKSAQTQFKTALRNHIDLSSIADNKANMMVTVNALIITVALPLLMTQIQQNPDLTIPSIILAAGSLISMFYATVSTRPVASEGRTTIAQIEAKKSNLFFYGNFFNMTFDEYEECMRRVVADNDILDNSITRDLFFLGSALGKKFQHLRWCYNIFMYSIIASVLAFVIASLL